MVTDDMFRHIHEKGLSLQRKHLCLFHHFVQITLQEEGLGGKEETGDTSGIDKHYGPKGRVVAQELGDDAAHEDAESHADIP